MTLVITDSTALISLDRIDRLDLLPAVYANVMAPPAVVDEFGQTPDWLVVRPPRDREGVRALRTKLDVGEAEAIALALEHPGSKLLLDERRGRSYASELGIATVGTFGLLIVAKRMNLIPAVHPLLDALINAGFHASDALYRRTLLLAGEDVIKD